MLLLRVFAAAEGLPLIWMQVWDTASGQLKLTLTGHIEQVRLPSLTAFCLPDTD